MTKIIRTQIISFWYASNPKHRKKDMSRSLVIASCAGRSLGAREA